MTFDGSALQQIGSHYYLVFPWMDGSSCRFSKSHRSHAELIGEQFAQIHDADLSSLRFSKPLHH